MSNPAQIEEYIRREADRIGVDGEKAVKIAMCESSLIPTIHGDSGESVGLWQIHLPAHPTITEAQAKDPVWSTQWALENMKEGKWDMWTCHKIVST